MATMEDGRWTKEPPTRPGSYFVADRLGGISGTPMLVTEYQGALKAVTSGRLESPAKAWLGWWWSEPVPNLPKPPAWEEEVP